MVIFPKNFHLQNSKEKKKKSNVKIASHPDTCMYVGDNHPHLRLLTVHKPMYPSMGWAGTGTGRVP